MNYWLLYYEDVSRGAEIFTTEKAARARYEQAKLGWSCHLFVQVELVDVLITALTDISENPFLDPDENAHRAKVGLEKYWEGRT